MKKISWLLFCFLLTNVWADAPAPPAFSAPQALEQVLRYREGLQSVVRYTQQTPQLFPETQGPARLLTRAEKESIWAAWKQFLDYSLALESLQKSAKTPLKVGTPVEHERFLVEYGAYLAQYRWTLDFLDRLDHDKSFVTILNEPVTEIGLPAGTFDRMKFRYLNVSAATRFVALQTIYKNLGGQEAPGVRKAAEEDALAIWKTGRVRGHVLTLKNAFQIAGHMGSTAWLPVQTGVSEWMGDTRVWRKNMALISADQITAMRPQLQPGDILIERREWYLSNIGLPGFWPHAALFVGSAAERLTYFGSEADRDLEALYASALSASEPLYKAHAPAVLEAMSEGVVFTDLEHSAAADSLVVLRPRLSKAEKAKALERAFHYAGRPYDFNFDFSTDSSLVCSELVYKAYEKGPAYAGLNFSWDMMLGRPVSSPNMMVQQFDAVYGTTHQQLDMILFLDGNEGSHKAYPASVQTFRESWKRPKWHIWIQEKPVL